MTVPPHRPVAGRDTKSNLLDAARAAVKDREAAAVAAAVAGNAPRRRKRRLGTLAFLGVIGAVLLLIQPDWLVGPDAPPPESPAVATASLRLTLVRDRSLVLAYQKRFGRLPQTLRDAGVESPGLQYQRLGPAGFSLQARLGDSVVTITATDSIGAFLGSNIKTLQQRGRP